MFYGYALAERDELIARKNEMLKRQISSMNFFVDVRKKQTYATTTQNRPRYIKLLEKLKPGDVVCLKNLDDLGYGYEDILEQWIRLTQKCKADVFIIDMPIIDTRFRKDIVGSYLSDVFVALFGYVANKRKVARQHQQESFASSRAKGVRFGAPPKPLPDNFTSVCEDYLNGKIFLSEAARKCNMASRTFKTKLAERLQDNSND